MSLPPQVSVLNHFIIQETERSYEEPVNALFKINAFLIPLHQKHLFLFMKFSIYKRISHIFILETLLLLEKTQTTKQTNERKKKKNNLNSHHGNISKETETGCLAPWWGIVTHAGSCSARHSSASISPVHSSELLSLDLGWAFCNSH